ncbi:MAG TPA: ABC transporter permease [Candidatus Acidoferrales bacterium]|nr:ABC transporter permease [Candidatus Acidoferrales bacterium]
MIPLWLYRRLLAFYPADVRREYGALMAEEFRDGWAEARLAGGLALAAFWLHLVRDWAESAAAAHAEIARQDLRSAAGSLRRRPISTGALIVLFGFVISANTVMVVVARCLLWEPLSFEARGPLVVLTQSSATGTPAWQTLPAKLVDQLARESRTMEDVAFVNNFTVFMYGQRHGGYYAAPAAFRNFGITAAAGRLFRDGDGDVAVIGARLWRDRYHGLASAIGSILNFAGRDYRIVGALSQAPGTLNDADLWIPSRPFMYGGVIARLKHGARLRDAQAEWLEFQRREGGRRPAGFTWFRRVNMAPEFDFIIWLCQAAFLIALLLACADLASFQFGHMLRRQRGIAVRMAVGASRGRLLRFLLTESVVTAVLAGAVSLPLSAGLMWFLHAHLDAVGVSSLWGWSEVRLDRVAVLVAIVLSLASGVFSGWFPAWRTINRNPWPMLAPPRGDSRWAVGRLRLALLATQVALAVPLLIFAIAFSVEGSGRLDSGAVRYFKSSLQVTFTFPNRPSPSARDLVNLIQKITSRLQDKGYQAILTDALPFLDDGTPFEYEAAGRHVGRVVHVNSHFFDIPGFRFRRGGRWTPSEERQFPPPVVVNQAIARQAGTVVGKLGDSLTIVNSNGTRVSSRIAGIVDQPPLDLYGSAAQPTIFVPYPFGSPGRLGMVVRFNGDSGSADSARAAIEAAFHEVDPDARPGIQDYGARIQANWIAWRYLAGFLSVAGLLALGLAVTGATAYLAQTFSERSHEVALRCAFGSQIAGIWIWITRQVVRALAAVTILAAGGAYLIKWLPSGMVPATGLALWAGFGLALALLWAAWSAVCWLASRRAAAEPLMSRLRHI